MAGWRGRGWTEGKEAEEETRGTEGEGDRDGVKESGRCAVEWAREGTGESSLNCTRNRPLAASGGGEEKQRQGLSPRALRPGPLGSSGPRSRSPACTVPSERAPRPRGPRQRWVRRAGPSHPGTRKGRQQAQRLLAWGSTASGRTWSLAPQVLRGSGGTAPNG